eukprot:12735376-Ditylum_brightwellii.AAC.1
MAIKGSKMEAFNTLYSKEIGKKAVIFALQVEMRGVLMDKDANIQHVGQSMRNQSEINALGKY